MNLKIITSTNRPGAKGIRIAQWIAAQVAEAQLFDIELLDLAVINLPFMDEPEHPRLQRYTHEHTKLWSQTISDADAFIIALGEYNHGFPAPIKNAIDYLVKEWAYKPVALVSYGGTSGGLRAMAMLKPTLLALNMMPLSESVSVPFFSRYFNADDQFLPDNHVKKSTETMITELHRWSLALKGMRSGGV
ncbi:MAG: NAD(P)H-dependent oxidoreductase [Mucilaginibacter polytrichastri]|nr:NAD(P)H-dependent oxidoreductase [Mucilaginibacter polytrichastri]